MQENKLASEERARVNELMDLQRKAVALFEGKVSSVNIIITITMSKGSASMTHGSGSIYEQIGATASWLKNQQV